MSPSKTAFLVTAIVASLAACGGSESGVGNTTDPTSPTDSNAPSGRATASSPPPAPASTGSPDSGTPTSDSGTQVPPGACNAFDNDGAIITAQMVATDAPVPTGGAIADGKYHLSAVSIYTGAGGTSGPVPSLAIKSTIVVQGNVVQVTQDLGTTSVRLTESYAASGPNATFTESCPGGRTSSGTFSAGSSLVLYLPNQLGQTVGYTYSPSS